jgi:predicted nucleic acid-binding Zn ribbon protein
LTQYRRAPRQLDLALTPLREAWQPQTTLAEIQRVWEVAVGAAIAREARPVSERGGVVTVVCSASVWAHELDLMGPSIIARVNEQLQEPRVQKLRCRCTE